MIAQKGAPAPRKTAGAPERPFYYVDRSVRMIPTKAIKTHVYLEREMYMEFEGLHITVTRFTRIDDDCEWEIPAHAHMNYEMHYIYDGTGSIGLGDNVFRVGAGDFYICPPFIDHSQKADCQHPMREYCIECSLKTENCGEANGSQNESVLLLQRLSQILYCKYSDSDGILIKNFSQMDAIFSRYKEAERFQSDLLVKALMLQTILSMLIFSTANLGIQSISRNQNNINYQRASSIKNYLEANYKTNITIKDCTQVFYLSARQIDRILEKEYNETFHEMLTKTRVNVAIKLMQTTDYSMERIAAEAGFSGYRQMLRSLKNYGIERPARLREQDQLGRRT